MRSIDYSGTLSKPESKKLETYMEFVFLKPWIDFEDQPRSVTIPEKFWMALCIPNEISWVYLQDNKDSGKCDGQFMSSEEFAKTLVFDV